ncbi:DUF1661 domain-containing protein [Porphyromonas gingivalis]|nr:DUF1661 domain-containing protein [Porphyromonas gingivalis]MCE8172620.1 DUF1661 domain-containing protein [Porphyromonas gingivalis]MCE8174106.1 DUF1661 domain-containing protein [Porphyromonas gingivalis]MCE8176059.1 DUF1661 domain-containing protein [Porphyromonas gingivalis]MCE8178716.1 DUF1661 domain-containing protein [Porphyromonas gingivalis]
MAREFFHSRTKTKKFSRHLFQYHKPRFLRAIFPFLRPLHNKQSLLFI